MCVVYESVLKITKIEKNYFFKKLKKYLFELCDGVLLLGKNRYED